MPHFKAFGMINLQDEKILDKATNDKIKSGYQWDNNLNYINFHFHEYITEKLRYKDITCLILKLLA